MTHHTKSHVPDDQAFLPTTSAWRRIATFGAIVGLIGLIGIFVVGRHSPRPHFYFSYLTSYLFWLSIALGGLFFVIVQFAVRAGWSVVVRRLAENVMIATPFFAVLFIPIILGAHDLFHWTHHDVVEHDSILAGKASYLNLPFFYVRAVLYFAIWTFLSIFYFRKSVRQDQTGSHDITRRLQIASGPAIALFGLSLTFAAFDWIMSLGPHWYSTIFGVYYFAGSVVAIFSTLSLLGILLRRNGILKDVITVEHYHDLGKLLFAFNIFWSYIAFSQYMLYWYGNIPEETIWFRHRWEGGWQAGTILLALGHFVAPFFFLMTRITKRKTGALAFAAVWMLTVHYLDLYWLVMPTLLHEGPEFGMLDVFSMIGIGGIFIAIVGLNLRRHALVPLKDPRLSESLAFENF